MTKKTLKLLLILSTIFAFIYVGLLFSPYFLDRTSGTDAINHLVYGYQVGFGKNGYSDVKIIGSYPIMICEILGMAGSLLSLVFLIWYFHHTKESPFFYFLFALTIPFLAFSGVGIALSWPIYQSLNALRNAYVQYTLFYFISLVSIVLAFLINAFLLLFFAINRKNDNVIKKPTRSKKGK